MLRDHHHTLPTQSREERGKSIVKKHPDENRDEGEGGGQEWGAHCGVGRSEEFRAEPDPVPDIQWW